MYMELIGLYLKDTVDSLMKYYVWTQLISAYIVSIRNDVMVMGIDSKLAVARSDIFHGSREISARFIVWMVNALRLNNIYIYGMSTLANEYQASNGVLVKWCCCYGALYSWKSRPFFLRYLIRQAEP